jgi:hypothetical protein
LKPPTSAESIAKVSRTFAFGEAIDLFLVLDDARRGRGCSAARN